MPPALFSVASGLGGGQKVRYAGAFSNGGKALSARLRGLVQRAELVNISHRVKTLVGEELSRVEAEMAKNLHSPFSPVAEMGAYLAASRGKRLRPTILLLCGKTIGYEGALDVTYAAIFEFIHTATLIHDDIVDQALLRRGRASLSSRWGQEQAVLMGDRVFVMAMDQAIKQGWSSLLPLISKTTLRLIEGELIQSHRKWDLTLRRKDNLEIIKKKTAFLFSACAATPAHLMEAPEPTRKALEDYGLNLGIAFQMVDDCLDFVSNEETLGKPAGNDLKEGKITLPLLLLLQQGTPEDKAFIEAVVASHRFDPDTLHEVTERVKRAGALDEALEVAGAFASAARDAIRPLPDNAAHDLLDMMPDYILHRRF